MNKINSVRGTKDLFEEQLLLFNFIEHTAAALAESYMFKEIRIPIIEYIEVFIRNLGETSDVVNKEIYSFPDKSGEILCLRPEFTAGVIRAFVNNLQHLPLPLKLYSSGPLFRYERPQKGRYRQFHQVNFEIIGAKTYKLDIELILLADSFLKKLGLKDYYILELNSLGCDLSRSNYKAALIEYFHDYRSALTPESLLRLEKNPLRILDSKDRNEQQLIEGAPKIGQFYTEEAKDFFNNIMEALKTLNVGFALNDKLVRGLDYYSHTIFEFKAVNCANSGAQDTILAGGRYENLVSNLGGKPLPAVGFAAGIERLMDIVSFPPVKEEAAFKTISIIPIGEEAEQKALELSYKLRNIERLKIDLQYGLSLKSRMKRAEAHFAVIIFGLEELNNNTIKLKLMKTGEETIIPLGNISDNYRNDNDNNNSRDGEDRRDFKELIQYLRAL